MADLSRLGHSLKLVSVNRIAMFTLNGMFLIIVKI